MATDIAIIGNGPSRDIYKEFCGSSHYDVVVGCNYPDPDIKVDYSSFVDAYACRLMRKGALHESRRGEFKLILGERCVGGLKRVKATPASIDSLYEAYEAEGLIQEIVQYPLCFRKDQRYLSSGHLAYYWAATQGYKDINIHVFGHDSLFTGDHLSSYSNIDVRDYGDKAHIDRNILDRPRKSCTIWWDNWELMWKHYLPEDARVFFYGIIGDPPLPFKHQQVEPVYIDLRK